MSYSVWLEADLGGPEAVALDLPSLNITYNVCPMFREAIGESPRDWKGKSAAEVRAKCRVILAAFRAEPAKYRAMNPANGWGDFEHAGQFVANLAEACDRAPNATVVVC